jgi:hypothetical protein
MKQISLSTIEGFLPMQHISWRIWGVLAVDAARRMVLDDGGKPRAVSIPRQGSLDDDPRAIF